MAYLDDITAARDNLAEEIRRESARRVALTRDGHPPPTTYQAANGRKVDWNEYLKTARETLAAYNAILAEQEVYEIDVVHWN